MLSPGKIGAFSINHFLALKPQSHLFHVIVFIAGMVDVLSVVDVQVLGVLCVVSISTAKHSDRRYVVHEQVNLQHVEVIAYTQLDENILMHVEHA